MNKIRTAWACMAAAPLWLLAGCAPTVVGGVAIGAFVALTAPMVATIYQGRPSDTNRLTINHQTLVAGYGAIAAAAAGARSAARAGAWK